MNHENSKSEPDFFERLNYFFGKLLTVRDFQDEQKYFNEKRWLLNRYTIGWGVLCGLKVKAGESQNDKPSVIVQPGLAIDCYGNEIFVGKDTRYELEIILPADGEADYYLAIRYKECMSEPVPAPTPPCDGTAEECNYGRVREMYELTHLKEADLPEVEKFSNGCNELIKDQCYDYVNTCPSRSKYEWIVLAKITVDKNGIIHIDNRSHRKWLWSNETIGNCLQNTIEKVGTQRIDRRQFVPLLAQTIKGIEYRDGRILTISDHWSEDLPGKKKLDVGVQPYDITTDGEYIWLTDIVDKTDRKVLKLNREGTIVEKLAITNKSWGIAYDGCYMWVTHPDDNSVSKIPKMVTGDDELDGPIDIQRSNPKDIIYAENYVWIACDGGIQKIDIRTEEMIDIDIQIDINVYVTPISLCYDGQFIWILYLDNKDQGQLNKIDIENHELKVDPPIFIGQEPKCIAFDGTHLWVTHSKGCSQIDIFKNQKERTADADNFLTGAAFDGNYLWVAEPASGRVDRIDIHETKQSSEFRPTDDLKTPQNFNKMCFDGSYIWVTDYIDERAGKKGVIHRLLV